MITVLNFANGQPYERYRKFCSLSAKWIGKADKIVECRFEDIPDAYKEKHKEIFNNKRGCGLWLWKPYIIYQTLLTLADNEWLLYVDAGTIFVNKIDYLLNCAEQYRTDVMLFELPLLNRQFTKKECYVQLGIKDYEANQLAATYLLIKKTSKACSFIREWLECCEDEKLLSPKRMNLQVPEFKDFYSHREDQSILTLLRLKYDMQVFRDCSDFGEFPHMYFSSHYDYNVKEYTNSTFPTIVLSNRRSHPVKYCIRYWMKCILKRIGLINSDTIINKKIQKNI